MNEVKEEHMKATIKIYDKNEMEWKSVEISQNDICITQDEQQPWYYFASFVREEIKYYVTINAYSVTDIKSLQEFLDIHFKEFLSFKYFHEFEDSFQIKNGFEKIISVETFFRQKEYNKFRELNRRKRVSK